MHGSNNAKFTYVCTALKFITWTSEITLIRGTGCRTGSWCSRRQTLWVLLEELSVYFIKLRLIVVDVSVSLEINCNIYLPYLCLPHLFLFSITTTVCYCCLPNAYRPGFAAQTIMSEKHKLWNSSLCSFIDSFGAIISTVFSLKYSPPSYLTFFFLYFKDTCT
jgi:hypothetical protein